MCIYKYIPYGGCYQMGGGKSYAASCWIAIGTSGIAIDPCLSVVALETYELRFTTVHYAPLNVTVVESKDIENNMH